MKRTIICFALILAMLCPALFSCGSNNMKFSSEQEMIEYLNGTFENEDMMYIIQSGEITEVDKAEAFSTAEQKLKKVAFSLPENASVDKLKLDQFLEYCYGVNEYDVAYNNKKGTISFGGKTLSVDLDGNLCDKEGKIYKWISEEASPNTDLMKEQYDKYMPVLLKYYVENIGINIAGTWRFKFAKNVETGEDIYFPVEDYEIVMKFNEDGTGNIGGAAVTYEKIGDTDELSGYKITQIKSNGYNKWSYEFNVFCMFEEGTFYLATIATREYPTKNEYLYYAKD